MLEYCKNAYRNLMEVCEVRVTPGFNLNMDIIHVLTPIYQETKEPINKLIKAYNNVLDIIKNNNYKKVIIPSLGAGISGYSHAEVEPDL